MRLLFVHADRFSFEVTGRADRDGTGDRREERSVPREGRTDDCVVAVLGVESADQLDLKGVAGAAAEEVREAADRLNADRVVLYPLEHLVADSAPAAATNELLADLRSAVEGEYELLWVPAGYHVAVEVSCKGHPASTFARRASPPADDRDGAGDAVDWHVRSPDGTRTAPGSARPDAPASLRALIDAGPAPTSDRSPDSDDGDAESGDGTAEPVEETLGAVRRGQYRPQARFVRDALVEYARNLALEAGAAPVGTPTTHGLDARSVREGADAGNHTLSVDGRRVLLRDGTAGGQASLLAEADLSASDLPARTYECGPAFDPARGGRPGWIRSTGDRRDSGSGADSGGGSNPDPEPGAALVRHLPETVAVCTGERDGLRELRRQAETAASAAAEMGVEWAPAVRVTAGVHERNPGWVERIIDTLGRPALVGVTDDRPGDWAARVEFATADREGRPIPTASVELDVETAGRVGLTFEADGESSVPVVVRGSPTGPVGNAVRAVGASATRRDRPRVPTWLAPTQVRLLPVADDHVGECERLCSELAAAGVRADVDARRLPVGERVDRATADRVPYWAVVGDRERDRDALPVTVRETGREVALSPAALAERIDSETEGLPALPRYLPERVGCRPRILGG